MTQPVTREEIAAALKAGHAAQMQPGQGTTTASSEDVSRGILPAILEAPDPRSLRPKEPGDPGPAIPLPPTREYTNIGGYVVPKPRTQLPPDAGVVDVIKAAGKEAGRTALDVASGRATEKVAESVAGAPGQAAEEVKAKSLQSLTPEALALLQAQANPEGGSIMLVRTPRGWVPSTNTKAEGTTSKDPAAIAEALRLQERAGYHEGLGLERQQAAERAQTDALREVQKNEFQATQEFKRQSDDLNDRYTAERQAQLDKLKSIQKAMDAVPNAPRTIAEKFARSGTEDKIRYGLAAMFSVIGGAALRDGGKSAQTLLNTMQANIDRDVQKEADEYARFGERAKMSNNLFAHVRDAVQDDRAALNIVKALYYDAAMNTVEQIAGQYKMDMQGPQISQFMARLLKERQALVLDTAATMQDQISETQKFQPGGVVAVGGAGKYKGGPLEEAVGEYGIEFEKRGGNSASRALALYQQAIDEMKAGGFSNDQKFWSVFAAMNSADSPKLQAAILSDANLNDKQRAAMQHIIDAGSEQLRDESGKAVTANELARDVMKKGGYSITSLDTVRDSVAKKRENIYNSTDATFGGPHNLIGDAYRARQDIAELRRQNPGIGTSAPQPIDPSDIETRVRGRLE